MKLSLSKLGGVIITCALLLSACTAPGRSEEALQKAGFTEIQTTGYSAFACSDSDDYHTGFRAKNPQGVVVTGTVCCGWLKSCTIRF